MTLLEKKHSGKYYDEWESQPDEIRADEIHEKLDQYIHFAREHVPFYRERLNGYNKKASCPLKNVPVLTSSQLRELLPPASNQLLAEHGNNYTVFQSGGTTGIPKTTLFSNEELEQLTLPNARGFYALGLSAQDRVANLFAVGGLYMTFIHINRMLQQYGCVNFPFSNHTPVDFIYTVVKLFAINCFTGIASVVLDCLRKMAELGLDGVKIDKLLYGGERIYEADKIEMREKLGIPLIAAPGYGTVDSWYIGYQCVDCPTNVFHVHDDQTYLEVVDEETQNYCDAGKIGMLYATPFPRRLTPIVKYKVGDLGMWMQDKCRCGRTTPLFQLLGRGDDVLRIGYDSIDYNYVQVVAATVEKLHSAIQMEKRREMGRDRLIIRIETEAPSSEYEAIARTLENKILQERPSLREFIAKGTVWPLQIELVRPEAIPRNVRTGKLIRVIDS